jgi:hypothetical protein
MIRIIQMHYDKAHLLYLNIRLYSYIYTLFIYLYFDLLYFYSYYNHGHII